MSEKREKPKEENERSQNKNKVENTINWPLLYKVSGFMRKNTNLLQIFEAFHPPKRQFGKCESQKETEVGEEKSESILDIVVFVKFRSLS